VTLKRLITLTALVAYIPFAQGTAPTNVQFSEQLERTVSNCTFAQQIGFKPEDMAENFHLSLTMAVATAMEADNPKRDIGSRPDSARYLEIITSRPKANKDDFLGIMQIHTSVVRALTCQGINAYGTSKYASQNSLSTEEFFGGFFSLAVQRLAPERQMTQEDIEVARKLLLNLIEKGDLFPAAYYGEALLGKDVPEAIYAIGVAAGTRGAEWIELQVDFNYSHQLYMYLVDLDFPGFTEEQRENYLQRLSYVFNDDKRPDARIQELERARARYERELVKSDGAVTRNLYKLAGRLVTIYDEGTLGVPPNDPLAAQRLSRLYGMPTGLLRTQALGSLGCQLVDKLLRQEYLGSAASENFDPTQAMSDLKEASRFAHEIYVEIDSAWDGRTPDPFPSTDQIEQYCIGKLPK
jgi:hypothetical protein